MTENKTSDLVIDAFKGVGAFSGTIGLTTGSKVAVAVSVVSAITVDAMEFARGGASFIGRLVITSGDEGKTYRDVARKLRSKAGAKVTVDAIKTLSDLIDESAEPPLRRLALDYVDACQRPDAFFRCFSDMLTHCDAEDIRAMRTVFNMMVGLPVGDVMVAPGASIARDGDKSVITPAGDSTIAILSAPSGGFSRQSMNIVRSATVIDPDRAMRLLDDYRITQKRNYRVMMTDVTGGVIAKEHVGCLVRAFSQT